MSRVELACANSHLESMGTRWYSRSCSSAGDGVRSLLSRRDGASERKQWQATEGGNPLKANQIVCCKTFGGGRVRISMSIINVCTCQGPVMQPPSTRAPSTGAQKAHWRCPWGSCDPGKIGSSDRGTTCLPRQPPCSMSLIWWPSAGHLMISCKLHRL